MYTTHCIGALYTKNIVNYELTPEPETLKSVGVSFVQDFHLLILQDRLIAFHMLSVVAFITSRVVVCYDSQLAIRNTCL